MHLDAKGTVVVGASARDHMVTSPDDTAARFKRLMGTARSTSLRRKESGVLEVLATVRSTGEAKTLIIEDSPGAMTPEAIAKRFKELEKIKIHPREEAVNEALISRGTAAYENALGQRRNQIGMLLSTFHVARATHDKRHIAQTRARIEDNLKGLKSAGVLD